MLTKKADINMNELLFAQIATYHCRTISNAIRTHLFQHGSCFTSKVICSFLYSMTVKRRELSG